MVFIVDHGIAQGVVFIAVFQNGALELGAFFKAQAFCQAAGGNVADDNFQRDDGDPFYQGFPVGKLLHIMGGDAFFLQHPHQMVGDPVVDDAFAPDSALFGAVAGSGVVLIVYQVNVRIVGAKNLFGLSFIKLFHFFHNPDPPFGLNI